MTSRALVVWGCLMACGPSSADATDEGDDALQDESAIVNGAPVATGSELARRLVFFTVAGTAGAHGCTASVLDASHVLTASHCRAGADNTTQLVFSVTPATGTVIRPVTRLTIYPGSDFSANDDIMVAEFSGGLPAGYEPVTLGSTRTRVAAKTKVIQVGYGATDLSGNGRGVLRSVSSVVKSVRPKSKVYTTQSMGQGICSGDSGGPDFVTVNGALVQVGVHSTGDCQGASTDTDVRAYLPWIASTGATARVAP